MCQIHNPRRWFRALREKTSLPLPSLQPAGNTEETHLAGAGTGSTGDQFSGVATPSQVCYASKARTAAVRGDQPSPIRGLHQRRVSSAVEQRFCKPLVGSSNLSPGTTLTSRHVAWASSRAGFKQTKRQSADSITSAVLIAHLWITAVGSRAMPGASASHTTAQQETNQHIHMIKFGINYRFGWPAFAAN